MCQIIPFHRGDLLIQELPFSFGEESRNRFFPGMAEGGLPKSCARQAADTIEPISGRNESYSSGWRVSIALDTSLPNERPTHETSRLCVKRLWTKILPGRGNTCVLFCRRRKGAEKQAYYNPFEIPSGFLVCLHGILPFRNVLLRSVSSNPSFYLLFDGLQFTIWRCLVLFSHII